MLTITSAELKSHVGKYSKLAETEKIEVTKNGVVIFTMVPKGCELAERLETFFGTLPPDATIGEDPDERG